MNLTPLDILLLGLVAFAAWRFFASRKRDDRDDRGGPAPRPPDQVPPPDEDEDEDQAPPQDQVPPGDEDEVRRRQAAEAYRRAQASWDALRSKPAGEAGGAAPQQAPEQDAQAPAPGDGDFLAGAKAMFTRIRESWGEGDLEDIRQFVTDRGLAEFTARAGRETPPGRTEVILVEAEIMDRSQDQGREAVRVRYKALVREAAVGDAAREVIEDWTFVRDAADPAATWRLDAAARV